MLTGCYPSSNRVYQFGGSLHGKMSECAVSNVLHGSGYATAASVANPGAHPTCLGVSRDFDILPAPPLTEFPMREATTAFGSAMLASDLHFASVFFPYMLEHLSPRAFAQLHSIFPPERSFQQAERMLRDLPSPFFLWVHVFAPHYLYLPAPPYLRRFLPTQELRTHAEFVEMLGRSGFDYDPSRQALVSKGRLRYDEWIAQADAAFGDFMARLAGSRRLADTAVIVSADHVRAFRAAFSGMEDLNTCGRSCMSR